MSAQLVAACVETVAVSRVALAFNVAIPSLSDAIAAVTTAPVLALATLDNAGAADKAYKVKV